MNRLALCLLILGGCSDYIPPEEEVGPVRVYVLADGTRCAVYQVSGIHCDWR